MPDQKKDRLEASLWAQKLLAGEFGDWVILDSETTGLYGAVPIELCVISKYGSSMLNTRIKSVLPIEECAKAVHRISEEDLVDAPTFDDIYPRLKEVLEDKLVVIYNADFDTNVIFNAIRLHKLPRIRFKSDCVMEWYAQYYGEWSSYWGNYKWQKLPGQRSHTAYGDCLDTLKLIKRMAEYPEIENSAQKIHHKLFPPFQIGIRWQKCIQIEFSGRRWDKNYKSYDDYNGWRRWKKLYIPIPKLYQLSDKDIEEVIYPQADKF